MTYHAIPLGIEHLMTGVVLEPAKGHAVQFVRDSPSIVLAISDEPFTAHWPNRSHLDSTPREIDFKQSGDGEVEWYAQVVAQAMRDTEDRLYKMQTYCRRTGEYGDSDSRYAPNEPRSFPPAVVNAMRRKHGKDTAEFLAKLRWAGDHWFYNHDRMYIGVEVDGYIHT